MEKKVIIKDGVAYKEVYLMNDIGEVTDVALEATDDIQYIGDVNPFEHGGILYIEEENSSTEFRFVGFRERSEEGRVEMIDGIIDISDSWIEMEEVADYAGITEFKLVESGMGDIEEYRYQLADACTSYYGIDNFSGTLECMSEEEAVEKLKDFYGFHITFE